MIPLSIAIAIFIIAVTPLMHCWTLTFPFRSKTAVARRISQRMLLPSSRLQSTRVSPKNTATTLFLAPTGPPSGNIETGGYSYKEEDDYESPEEEIEAMGGDPYFLQEDSEAGNLQVSEGWDGTIDEDAYFDE